MSNTEDVDSGSIEIELFIAASPAVIFRAITDPHQVPQWWGQPGAYVLTGWEGEQRKGGTFVSTGRGVDGREFEVRGEYVEFDPPYRLTHTWIPSYQNIPVTTVCWELKEQEGGTLVRLRHKGFAGHATPAHDHANGWLRVTGWLKSFVEHGETVNDHV